jgi:hypothetical protein
VLSARRPAPGHPRTGEESAIEAVLREQDGLWLAPPAEPASHVDASTLDGWGDYVLANTSFAERILELVSPGGMVWIHGHAWLLAAAALRVHRHRGPIGLLLDAPFPPHDRLGRLPWFGDVMAALGQFDLIGVRSPDCAHNYEVCRLRAGRRRPWLEIVPHDAGAAPRRDPLEWVTSFLRLLASAARREPRPTAD